MQTLLMPSLLLAVCLPVPVVSASGAMRLFNGRDLTGFTTWLADTKREDPRGVFSVVDGAIRISGEGLGYLSTVEEYGNYRLRAEFKWGAKNWPYGDRTGKARDSGIFLHSTGPDGNSHDGGGAFKAAIECNLFQGATGDLLLIRGTDESGKLIAPRLTASVADGRDANGWYTWQRSGREQTIERWGRLNWSGKSRDWRDVTDFRGERDVERAPGEWNRVECLCEGGGIRIALNGATVNESRDVWPQRGRILFQCEGSEVYFRNVELEPVTAKPAPEKLTYARVADAVVLKNAAGAEMLRYQLVPLADAKLSVTSGCYFHPLKTPAGVAVTDVAPDDHRHHRGVFLAFLEMHGRKDADFWGWGEHAPVKDRQIVNTKISEMADGAGFQARNEWRAEGDAILVEDLTAISRIAGSAQVVDLDYKLTADAETKLPQWAFSGFSVRLRKDGTAAVHDPNGEVKRPAPVHTKPETDWPAAAWYAMALALDGGVKCGAAVIGHPDNPPALWHNHAGIRLLNPCVVAPGPVTLKAKEPMRLRYRVVVFDGEVPKGQLDELAKEFGK